MKTFAAGCKRDVLFFEDDYLSVGKPKTGKTNENVEKLFKQNLTNCE